VTERITLPNGDWVDVVERLNHAQYSRIRKAESLGLDRVDEGICAMVIGWALRDVDDKAIPFPELGRGGIPNEALDLIPIDSFVVIATEAAKLLTQKLGGDEGLVPKDGGETSSDSVSQEAGSPLIPTLPMPTSSPSSQAGRGKRSSPPLPM